MHVAEIPELTFEQRLAQKQAARRADDRAVAELRKTPSQVRRESESFAFGPTRARLNFTSLRPLVSERHGRGST